LSERASLVLWEEGDWRCEFNPGLAGVGRLEVYQADQLILAEEAPLWAKRRPTRRNPPAALTERKPVADEGTNVPQMRGRVRVTGGRAPLLYFRCGVVGTYNPTGTDS
jgi:hypothetical protein